MSENLQNLITDREPVLPSSANQSYKDHEEPGNVFDDAFKIETVSEPKPEPKSELKLEPKTEAEQKPVSKPEPKSTKKMEIETKPKSPIILKPKEILKTNKSAIIPKKENIEKFYFPFGKPRPKVTHSLV